jgi:hypothetical protein
VKPILYYSEVGSYDGLIKISNNWVRVTGLNRIDKHNWIRHQGPPTKRMIAALKLSSQEAVKLFPDRKII